MNCYFEKVSRFKEVNFELPVRKTMNSAGYDFMVAEDIVLPPYNSLIGEFDYQAFIHPEIASINEYSFREDTEVIKKIYTLDDIAKLTKLSGAKPTLVSTGVKCYLPEDTYLELSVRSSCPLKYWIIMANGVGIIDADYADNPDNEGEIFFQLINLSSVPIMLRKGDVIGQGIIKPYLKTDNDTATGNRVGGFGSTNG